MKIYKVCGALHIKSNFPFRVYEYTAEEKNKTYKLPYENKSIKKEYMKEIKTMTYNNSPKQGLTFYMWIDNKDDVQWAVNAIVAECNKVSQELRDMSIKLAKNINLQPEVKYREED